MDPAAVDRPPPRCRACGERIGVYEPVVCAGADGIARRAALLDLPEAARASGLFHAACAGGAAGAAASAPPTL